MPMFATKGFATPFNVFAIKTLVTISFWRALRNKASTKLSARSQPSVLVAKLCGKAFSHQVFPQNDGLGDALITAKF